jgi:hypothetical protein
MAVLLILSLCLVGSVGAAGIKLTVQVNKSVGGTVSTDPVGDHDGTAKTVVTITAAGAVDIEATASTDCHFQEWTVTGNVTAEGDWQHSASTTVNVGSGGGKVTAFFNCTLTVEAEAGGTATITGDDTSATVVVGAKVSIEATATVDSGYRFDYWEVVSGSAVANEWKAKTKVTMMRDTTVRAHFTVAPGLGSSWRYSVTYGDEETIQTYTVTAPMTYGNYTTTQATNVQPVRYTYQPLVIPTPTKIESAPAVITVDKATFVTLSQATSMNVYFWTPDDPGSYVGPMSFPGDISFIQYSEGSGYPFSLYKTWYFIEYQDLGELGIVTIPIKATVVDVENVKVPAGLFLCYKITYCTVNPDAEGFDPYNPETWQYTAPLWTDWWSDEVKAPVRTETYGQFTQPMPGHDPLAMRVETKELLKYKVKMK